MGYNRNITPSPQGTVKVLPFIHLALIAGQVLFAIASYVVMPPKAFSLDGNADSLVYIAMALAIGGLAVGLLLFRQRLNKITPEDTLAQKAAAYQTASIIRFAFLEGPSLFAIVSYLRTGNLVFLALSGLIILCFIAIRPVKDKIIADLNLDNEKSELDSPMNNNA